MFVGLNTLGIVGGKTAPPQAPTLANLEPYRLSATTWGDVPYGGASWEEPTLAGRLIYQDMDIFIPSTAAPANGYPVVLWFHANSNDKDVAGSGALFDCKEEVLAQNMAFISVEFRHPVINADIGAPHNDVGQAVQFARGLATALDFDVNNMFTMGRSRGTLCLWQALQADLANPTAGNWRDRQSSDIRAVWIYNGQTTFDTEEFADLFVIPGERALFLSTHPNDARWGSAIQSIATAPDFPHVYSMHETAFPVGQVTAAVADDVHYAGFGSAFRDAYIAAGQTAKITAVDSVASAAAFTGAAAWFASKVV